MNANIQPTNNGQISFELTITQAIIATNYQQILQKVASTAEIKGFRKGKAPIAMVESSVDKSHIYSQVLDKVIPPAYAAEIAKQKINPIIDPQITPKQFEDGKDWIFSVTTVIKPDLDLGDYKKYVKKALSEYEKNKKSVPVEHSTEKGHEGHDHEGDAKFTVVLDSLLKETKIEVAPLLVDQEAKSQLSRLLSQLKELKLTIADFAKSQKKTQEELIAEYQKTAETNLKLELILDKLVMDENPTVTDDEVAKLQAPKGQEAYAKYIAQKQKVIDNLLLL
ncbi:MAG: trigger factor [bacterium]